MWPRRVMFLVVVIGLAGGLASCSCTNPHADPAIQGVVDRVKMDLDPLENSGSSELSADERAYRSFYGFEATDDHRIGSFSSGSLSLAGQFLSPRRSSVDRGTVVMVHGYFDHAGSYAAVVDRLVDEGYHVAIYDQPGHGLSDGKRASVRDFSTYREGLEAFLELVYQEMPPPYDLVAHSMGSTVVIGYLDEEGSDSVRHLVLMTPLIQDYLPRWVHGAGTLVATCQDHFPRPHNPRKNSSDPAASDFVRIDPLQSQCLSLRWGVALNRWRKQFDQAIPRPESPLVLFAGNDRIVDNEVGRAFFDRVFPNHRAITVEEGWHQFHVEAPEIRDEVLDLVVEKLGGGG